MGKYREFIDYAAISAGMALAISCYAVLADMLKMEYSVMLPLAIVLAAAVCMLAALSVAELASMFPSAPGIRTYLKQAFGNGVSLLLTFIYIGMVMLVAGVESYAFARIARYIGIGLPAPLLAATLVIGVVVLNLRGLELAYRVQTALTILLLLVFAGLSVYALSADIPAMPVAKPLVVDEGLANLPLLTGMAIFLFIGFEWVTPLGRRPEAYRRLIPWSMPVAIALLTILYGLFALAVLHVLPVRHPAMGGTPQLILGQLLFNDAGLYLMAVLSLLAMLTSFNAGLMGASRLLYAVAREGKLPKWCASLSLPACIPYAAILTIGSGALLAALFATLFDSYLAMAMAAAAISCLTYLALVLANLRLRASQAQRARPFRSPLPVLGQALLATLFLALAVATLLSTGDGGTLFILLLMLVLAVLVSRYDRLPKLKLFKLNPEKNCNPIPQYEE